MKSMTYEAAGVPHLKGDAQYNRKISGLVTSTRLPGVIGSPTGFASLFDLKTTGVKDPILVSGTDGVGTKLEVARLQKKHDTIGIDLVAMCVNDIITTGAQPLFFLDYFATGKFSSQVMSQVLKGIVAGCKQAGCSLTGGETAIMPGFYEVPKQGEAQYDLAGFAVGVVDRKKMITGKRIKKGHLLLGLASTGFHSNGYSLLRKVFTPAQLRGKEGKELLTPTQIYVKPIQALMNKMTLEGVVNITGGGVIDNLPRIIPGGLSAMIDTKSWRAAKIFETVQRLGKIDAFEMYRTFNMGIGMVVILHDRDVVAAQKILSQFKIKSWVIGEVAKATQGQAPVQLF